MGQTLQKKDALKTLRSIPFEHGFHFYTEKEYTGLTATSLPEFATKLETVDINSVLFHYPRGDFQKWIEDTLGDKELANRMCLTKKELSHEKLRMQLLKITKKRINELQILAKTP
jgi:hypothetical protein